jgi:hypothetical protein
VHNICIGRTIIGKNEYLEDYIRILCSEKELPSPILALSASYYKETLEENSLERKQVELAENHFNSVTAATIRKALEEGTMGVSTAVSAALLLHHMTIDPSRCRDSCWTSYILPNPDPGMMDDRSQTGAYLIIASVAILTMTALPLDRGENFQSNNYDWVGYDKTEQLEEVNSSLGLSRKMLYCIHLVTQIAKLPDNAKTHLGHNLLQSINSSVQKIGGTEEQVRKNIALRTAETYRLGAKLYLLCRLYECVNAN